MKAMSEIIGVSLLLSLAIVLALGFIYWGTGVYSGGSAKAQGIFDRGISKAYADVDIVNATWFSANNTVYVRIKNTGGIDLTKVYVMTHTQIGFVSVLEPGEYYETYFSLDSKPSKVIVVSNEGASDERPF